MPGAWEETGMFEIGKGGERGNEKKKGKRRENETGRKENGNEIEKERRRGRGRGDLGPAGVGEAAGAGIVGGED